MKLPTSATDPTVTSRSAHKMMRNYEFYFGYSTAEVNFRIFRQFMGMLHFYGSINRNGTGVQSFAPIL